MKLNISEIQLNLENLYFGSDEEKALWKAVSMCFPESVQVLCSLHMKKNIVDYLRNKIGVPKAARAPIVQLLFGPTGVGEQIAERAGTVTKILPDSH